MSGAVNICHVVEGDVVGRHCVCFIVVSDLYWPGDYQRRGANGMHPESPSNPLTNKGGRWCIYPQDQDYMNIPCCSLVLPQLRKMVQMKYPLRRDFICYSLGTIPV